MSKQPSHTQTANYSTAQHITTELKENFAQNPTKKAEAVKFLQDNKQRVSELKQKLQQAWRSKGESPSRIGFQSCARKAFTQNDAIKTLLSDPTNLKLIFYISALDIENIAIDADLKDEIKSPIFDETNDYTGLNTKLYLHGTDVTLGNGKQTPRTAHSLFSYIFLNVPELLGEMQVNGFSFSDRLDPNKVAAEKEFHATLNEKFATFIDAETITAKPLERYEEFLNEPYNHAKWQEYIARFRELTQISTYDISDNCDDNSKQNLDKSEQDITAIYSSSFAHFVLDPKHLESVLNINSSYGHNQEKFFKLLERISKLNDPAGKQAGEYIFKRLKLLEFEKHKDCSVINIATENVKQGFKKYIDTHSGRRATTPLAPLSQKSLDEEEVRKKLEHLNQSLTSNFSFNAGSELYISVGNINYLVGINRHGAAFISIFHNMEEYTLMQRGIPLLRGGDSAGKILELVPGVYHVKAGNPRTYEDQTEVTKAAFPSLDEIMQAMRQTIQDNRRSAFHTITEIFQNWSLAQNNISLEFDGKTIGAQKNQDGSITLFQNLGNNKWKTLTANNQGNFTASINDNGTIIEINPDNTIQSFRLYFDAINAEILRQKSAGDQLPLVNVVLSAAQAALESRNYTAANQVLLIAGPHKSYQVGFDSNSNIFIKFTSDSGENITMFGNDFLVSQTDASGKQTYFTVTDDAKKATLMSSYLKDFPNQESLEKAIDISVKKSLTIQPKLSKKAQDIKDAQAETFAIFDLYNKAETRTEGIQKIEEDIKRHGVQSDFPEIAHGFDWWMFPSSSPSKPQYDTQQYSETYEELRQDPEFCQRYVESIRIYFKACGYPQGPTFYNEYPVRFAKLRESLLGLTRNNIELLSGLDQAKQNQLFKDVYDFEQKSQQYLPNPTLEGLSELRAYHQKYSDELGRIHKVITIAENVSFLKDQLSSKGVKAEVGSYYDTLTYTIEFLTYPKDYTAAITELFKIDIKALQISGSNRKRITLSNAQVEDLKAGRIVTPPAPTPASAAPKIAGQNIDRGHLQENDRRGVADFVTPKTNTVVVDPAGTAFLNNNTTNLSQTGAGGASAPIYSRLAKHFNDERPKNAHSQPITSINPGHAILARYNKSGEECAIIHAVGPTLSSYSDADIADYKNSLKITLQQILTRWQEDADVKAKDVAIPLISSDIFLPGNDQQKEDFRKRHYYSFFAEGLNEAIATLNLTPEQVQKIKIVPYTQEQLQGMQAALGVAVTPPKPTPLSIPELSFFERTIIGTRDFNDTELTEAISAGAFLSDHNLVGAEVKLQSPSHRDESAKIYSWNVMAQCKSRDYYLQQFQNSLKSATTHKQRQDAQSRLDSFIRKPFTNNPADITENEEQFKVRLDKEKAIILKKFKDERPAIFHLQEAQGFFEKQRKGQNLEIKDAAFLQKIREQEYAITFDPNSNDLITVYDARKYKLIASHPYLKEPTSDRTRALITILEDKQTHSLSAMVNIHLEYDKDYSTELEQLKQGIAQKYGHIPIIMAGDTNHLPDEPSSHNDQKTFLRGLVASKQFATCFDNAADKVYDRFTNIHKDTHLPKSYDGFIVESPTNATLSVQELPRFTPQIDANGKVIMKRFNPERIITNDDAKRERLERERREREALEKREREERERKEREERERLERDRRERERLERERREREAREKREKEERERLEHERRERERLEREAREKREKEERERREREAREKREKEERERKAREAAALAESGDQKTIAETIIKITNKFNEDIKHHSSTKLSFAAGDFIHNPRVKELGKFLFNNYEKKDNPGLAPLYQAAETELKNLQSNQRVTIKAGTVHFDYEGIKVRQNPEDDFKLATSAFDSYGKNTRLQYMPFSGINFVEDENNEAKTYKIFGNANLFMAFFNKCNFINVDLSEIPVAVLDTIKFSDCTFINCLVPENFRFKEANLQSGETKTLVSEELIEKSAKPNTDPTMERLRHPKAPSSSVESPVAIKFNGRNVHFVNQSAGA